MTKVEMAAAIARHSTMLGKLTDLLDQLEKRVANLEHVIIELTAAELDRRSR